MPCNWISLRWPINVLESELFCGERGTGILHELIEEDHEVSVRGANSPRA